MRRARLFLDRRGQEKILLDLAAIVLFIMIVLIFLFLMNLATRQDDGELKTAYATHFAANHLLQFVQSEQQGVRVTRIFERGDSAAVEAAVNAYFDTYLLEFWTLEVIRGGSTPSSETYGHTKIWQLIKGYCQRGGGGRATLGGTTVSYTLQCSGSVVVEQALPLPEGGTMTLRLTSWVVY